MERLRVPPHASFNATSYQMDLPVKGSMRRCTPAVADLRRVLAPSLRPTGGVVPTPTFFLHEEGALGRALLEAKEDQLRALRLMMDARR